MFHCVKFIEDRSFLALSLWKEVKKQASSSRQRLFQELADLHLGALTEDYLLVLRHLIGQQLVWLDNGAFFLLLVPLALLL
jgi:hypothetical protein